MSMHSDPVVTLETVTPEMAAEWLAFNHDNRKIRTDRVMKIARSISSGEWLVNGATICFDRDCNLIDGQHRLSAIVEANMPVETFVMRNADPAAMITIDRNLSRTTADAFAWAGIPNSKLCSSAIRKYLWFLHGEGSATNKHVKARLTDFEILCSYKEWRDDFEWMIPLAMKTNKTTYITRSDCLVTMMWLRHSDCTPDAIQVFFTEVATGAYLTSDSPLLALRSWAINNRIKGVRLGEANNTIAIIKAWNDWANGRKRRIMRVQSTDSLPDVTPT